MAEAAERGAVVLDNRHHHELGWANSPSGRATVSGEFALRGTPFSANRPVRYSISRSRFGSFEP
jgi:hypothetical protein